MHFLHSSVDQLPSAITSTPNHAGDRRPQCLATVYQALAEHQVSDMWDLRDLLRELHRWVEILVFEFKLQIPEIALCVERLRFKRLGHFRCDRNGFGLRGEIALNRRHINEAAFWDVLGTLLHELLHAWQQAYRKPGKGHYHNVQYRRKAAEFGLIVDECGSQQYEPGGALVRLLQKHGVNVPKLPALTPSPVGSSKLKLWICRCEPPFRVRVARAGFAATCNFCGQGFVQTEPGVNERSETAATARERTTAARPIPASAHTGAGPK